MQNCVIYARFSSDKQREESIEGQIRECRAFAQTNDLEVIHIYADRAKSARTDHRPDFLKMIKDSAKGLFKYIVVYTLDRFSRSRYDSVTYKARLKKNGVKVLSAKENIKDDPSGIILESVLEGYAEYYSAELAQKVKRGMTDSILEHKWPGTPIPFGYTKAEDGTLAPDPDTSDAVEQVFAAIAGGHNRAEVVRLLASRHYKTAAGRPISYNMLTNILKNPLYTGVLQWGSQEIQDFVQPLISKDLFNAVQSVLATKNARRMNTEDYTLTGKLTCGICGQAMTGTHGTSKNGEKYLYYRCCSKNNTIRGKRKPCSARNVPVKWLEGIIFDTTINILNTPEDRKEIARQAVLAQSQHNARTDEEKRLKAELRDIEKRLKNSIAAIEAGVVSQTISDNISQYEAQVQDLHAAIDELKLKKDGPSITEEAVEFYFEKLLERAQQTGERKLDIFYDFIKSVVVFQDYILIYYNYLPTKRTPTPVEVRCSTEPSMVTPE